MRRVGASMQRPDWNDPISRGPLSLVRPTWEPPPPERTVEEQIQRTLMTAARWNELQRWRAIQQRRAAILRISAVVSPLTP
jgi:hypothetical protein